MVAELRNICKRYGTLEVLNNFSLDVKPKEIVCILGASGCGKSTLLSILSGVLDPEEGQVKRHTKRIGYVFQEDRLLPWKTVYDNIYFVNKESSEDEIDLLIEVIGLKGFEACLPKELSGGMRQRCSIARAFNYHPELLLMDEPFKALDYSLRLRMIGQLIEVWRKTSSAIVFVTHQIDEALMLGNRVIVLSERPATILKTYSIKTKQENRELNSKELTEVRNEIIQVFQTCERKCECRRKIG